MKKWILRILLLLLLLLLPLGRLFAASGSLDAPYRPAELIVRYRPGMAPSAVPPAARSTVQFTPAFVPAATLSAQSRPASLKALDQRFGLRVARPLSAPRTSASIKNSKPLAQAAVAPSPEIWLLRLDPAVDLNQALSAYRADPAVLYAEPNYEGALAFVPSDPLYSQESKNFTLIGLERAWDVRPGANRAVEVAIIDSGIDAAHPDLASALDLSGSYNFAENNTRIYDDIGHGTRVAGIIGATAANGEGIAGVAFGCRLMSLDVANSSGTITTADVASAIDWAVAKGAGVINLSLTFSAFSQTLSDACQAAVASGVVVVAAAGNENQGERAVYPASYDGVLGVGAVTADGKRCPWSNFNGTCTSLVHLVAPGETVFSTIPNGQYNGSYGSGTSFATPMVSGVAALLRSQYPLQSGAAIVQHILATAAPVSAAFTPSGGAGAGVLSAQRALETAMQPQLAVASVKVDDPPIYGLPNNGDGVLQNGECVRLRISLKNTQADVTNVTGTLDTTDTMVALGDRTGSWGSIASGKPGDPIDVFTSVTLASASNAHNVLFQLHLSADGGFQQTLHFQLRAENSTTPPTLISSDTTWGPGTTWIIRAPTVVMPPARLTILPGTTVRFDEGGRLEVRGLLDAQGTADSKITFTSWCGKPLGSFEDWVVWSDGTFNPDLVAYADLNRDWQNELIAAYSDAKQIRMFYWKSGVRQPTVAIDLPFKPYCIAVGDADNDGQDELLTCDWYGGKVQMLHWNGTGFDGPVPIASCSYPYKVIVKDLDGDGKTEVIIGSANYAGYAPSKLLLTRGSGSTFTPPVNLFDTSTYIGELYSCDINDDGKQEVYTSLIGSRDGSGITGPIPVYVWQFRNDSLIPVAQTSVSGLSLTSFGDSDNDGKKEIHFSCTDGAQIVRLDGSTFTPVGSFPYYNHVWGPITVGDVDNDGRNELILANWSDVSHVSTYRWDGAQFVMKDTFLPSEMPLMIISADIDQDGLNDLLYLGPAHGFLYKWNPGKLKGPSYQGIWITSLAGPCRLAHCDFLFAPVLDESLNTQFSDCFLDRSGGDYALSSTSGTLPLLRCTARGNSLGHGIVAGVKSLDGCVAENNRGIGLQGGSMTDCSARGNGAIGISSYRRGPFDWTALLPSGDAAPAQATRCIAENNGRTGIDVQTSAWGCTASGNGGNGIDAPDVTSCTATGNLADGISGITIRNSMAQSNKGKGIRTWTGAPASKASSADRCLAQDNSGVGIEVYARITSSTAVGNGQGGMKCEDTIVHSLATRNGGSGLDAQYTLASSASYLNGQHGAQRCLTGIQNSWLVANGAYGWYSLDSTWDPQASRGTLEQCLVSDNHGPGVMKFAALKNSTIINNQGPGVRSAFSMSGCSLYGNGGASGIDYEESRSSRELLETNLSGNYWGRSTTTLMSANPWQTYFNLPAIFDFLDNRNLCYVHYDPYLAAPPAAAMPDDSAPGFLLAASPDLVHPVNIGLATFRLTFSRAMNTAVPLSVTFGRSVPFASYVVAPAPGWVDPTTWQGSFAVQSDTAEGTSTLRVAGAVDATGFAVPEDTAHSFIVENSGRQSANNGLAIGQGTKMALSWSEEDKPATALGYNVLRSESGMPGTYARCNAALLTAPSFLDSGLKPRTDYYYMVYIVESGMDASQWTPPFLGTTGDSIPEPPVSSTAVRDWNGYQ